MKSASSSRPGTIARPPGPAGRDDAHRAPHAAATLKQDRSYTEIEPAVFDRGAYRDMPQRLGVIEFRSDPGADIPAHAAADARDLLRIRGRPEGFPAPRKIVKRHDLHRPSRIRIGKIGEPQPTDRDAQFARRQKPVIRHRQIGAITAHRAQPAERDLLHLEERAVGELEVGAKKYFPVLVDPAHILRLAEPGEEFRCRWAGN